jgi:hypothetical protein
MTKSRGVLPPRIFWTAPQLQILRDRYPHERTSNLVGVIGRNERAIYVKANKLGINKTAEYLASPGAHRLDGKLGEQYRFKKDHATWNKGVKGITYPGMEATQFKKGRLPHSWLPIGSERMNDGYLQRKMTDTGYPPRDWICVHILLWERHHGPVPKKHNIVFKDRKKSNIFIENLECISRADHMRRNTVHNLPKDVAQLVLLRGAVIRKINRRIKDGKST